MSVIVTEIDEQIDLLNQDISICENVLRNLDSQIEDRIEARARIRADKHEIARLTMLSISLAGDSLLYGGKS